MDIVVYANKALEIVLTVGDVLLIIGGGVVFLILHKTSHWLANLENKANQNGH